MRKLSLFACLLALAAVPLASGQTFQNQDVGGPAIEGSTEVSGDEIIVTGAGNDIWGNSDQFQFYYTTLVGDFDVSVRVDGLEGTHQWAKAELMIRSSGNSEEPRGGDPHISMMATRDGGQNNISPQWRKVRGGGSGWNGNNIVTPVPYPDVHFRMTKVGSVISGYFSEDGSGWTKMYEADTSDPDFDVVGQGGTWGNGVDFNSSPVYVGLAVTSHNGNETATAWFDDLEFTGDVTPAVPVVATITEQPENAEVTSGSSASFSVTVGNTFPTPTFQWTKNGTDIDGATGSSYTIDRAALADNGANFAVKVTNSEGTVTSDNASLTVNADNEPPTLASASGTETFTTVRVVFSEPLDEASAETAGNYDLSGGVTVSAAALAAEAGTAGDDTVILTTSRQPEGTVLTLTVNNVQDAAGNNAIAANSTIDFKTHVWVNGFVLYKRWDNIEARVSGLPHDDPDQTFRNLETLDAFPDNPDVTSLRPLWEAVTDGNELNNYAAQISGWITPAETTSYVFFTNSDDPSHLYLSPDNDPANKLLIAQQVQWSNARQWHTGNFPLLKRSDEFGGQYPREDVTDPEHEYDIWDDNDLTSNFGIPLEAGQRYYMESVHREGGGGGNVQATMITEDEAGEEGFPPNGTASTLTGDLIGTYLNPNGAEVTITQQPQDASALENRTVTFTVEAEGTHAYGDSLAYQWQSADAGSSNFADIEGATAASYTTERLLLEANNRQYRVMVGSPAFQIVSATSDVVTLSVNPDEDPPEIHYAVSLGSGDVVGIKFNERLDEDSAASASNYEVSGVSVDEAQLHGNENNVVVLFLSDEISANATVSATGVEDFLGNAIASVDATDIGTDVLAYWNFDDATNAHYTADFAHSDYGTLEGGAVFTDDGGGRSGQAGDRAVDLGTLNNGQHVSVKPAAWLNMAGANNQITFSFWQKWNQGIGNQSSFWAVSTGSSSGNRGAQAHTPWSNNNIYFDTAGCCDGGTQRINAVINSVFDEFDWEEWHHFAFVKDGDYKAIYVDGEFFLEGDNTNPLPTDFVRLMIGSDGNGGNSHGGLLDEFAVFGSALSESDIEKLAEGMRPDEIRTIVPVAAIEPPPSPPTGELSISVQLNRDGTVTLEFTGTLHSSDSITGMFEPVEGATSPYTVSVVPGNAPPPIPGQPTPDPTPVNPPQKFYLVR